MNDKIEKKNILPIDEELAKLKDAVLKQVPQLAKNEKKSEVVPSQKKKELDIKNDLAQKENADKDLESKLNESELETLTASESSE